MQLIVIEHNKQREVAAETGSNLLTVLRAAGGQVHAPCGGKGTCRKCLVEVDGLGPVLSCQTILDASLTAKAGLEEGQPLTVRLPDLAKAQISTDGQLPEYDFSPLIYKGMARLAEPTLDDQRPDDERLAGVTGLNIPFRLLGQLPAALRESGFLPGFYFCCASSEESGEILRFVGADESEPLGIAIDIGTTTLAAYLYDLGSGQRLASAAGLNPQSVYGADVISRIDQASSSPEMRQSLKNCIVQAIAGLAERLVVKARARHNREVFLENAVHYVIAGNTTMLHLLAGFPAAAIARSPFIPVSRRALTLQAGELGLPQPIAADAICQLLPSIASYVGADITAGILACGLHQLLPGQNALLLDIGTNGEIVLAGPQGLIACSTAAGPAFEGANIYCGTGGVQGAIDEVDYRDGDLVYTTIGEGNGNGGNHMAQPLGICGSGLVAAVATLLNCGILDETGRITDEADDLPDGLARRLVTHQGQPAVLLVPAEDSATGQPIILTQKDIREVQNAKAAIAAGITLLIHQAGLTPEQVNRTYIAGGFGNYLDVGHAFRIGLLPGELRGRTRAVGNTSGMGAVLCLLDHAALDEAEIVSRTVDYFELSGDSRFVDLYVEAMLFPEAED